LVIEDGGAADGTVLAEDAVGLTEQSWRMVATSSSVSIHLRPSFLAGNRPARKLSASQRVLQ
jgi:hypothetical protein